jgi:LmbE family N-acetylglucosaminyl deacetylase
VRAYVICLSGADAASPRAAEFEAARRAAGYDSGVVLGFPLRDARAALPDTRATTEEGLAALGLSAEDVSLLITHSPYGDEHGHPHHVQAYEELSQWAEARGTPFGYFSVVPLTFLRHRPVVRSLKRRGRTFHLLNLARCTPAAAASARFLDRRLRQKLRPPRWYVQFLTEARAKAEMLACYPSIDLESHAAGYAAFTSSVESLYLFDDRGLAALGPVLDAMEAPGAPDLYVALRPRVRAAAGRIAHRLGAR